MSKSTFRSFSNQSRAIEQRRVALKHHCRLAVETTHPRFRWVEPPHSVDVRNTPDGARRLQAVRPYLPEGWAVQQ